MDDSPSKRQTRSGGRLTDIKVNEYVSESALRRKRALPLVDGLQSSDGDSGSDEQPSPTKRTRSRKVFVEISRTPTRKRKTISPIKNAPNPQPAPEEGSGRIDPNSEEPLVESRTPEKEMEDVENLKSLPVPLPEHLHPYPLQQKAAVVRALQHPLADSSDDGMQQSASNQLKSLLDGTIHRREGNSCVVLGPKGCGKTRAMEACLQPLSESCIIIKLSGHVQVNDRLAMREIARQVSQQLGSAWGKDAEGDDDVGGVPPTAQLMNLAGSLPSLPKPVIIVIEAFDMFAFHARQALLYCLFDTVQSLRPGATNSGMAVLGVTSRLDFLNVLEKRVKSRFSHRIVRISQIPDVEAYMKVATAALRCPVEGTSEEWRALWTTNVETFLLKKSVVNWFSEAFNITREISVMMKQLIPLILRVTPATPWLNEELLSYPSLSASFEGTSYPTLCLLIAAISQQISGFQIFTFAMLEAAFVSQVDRTTNQFVTVSGQSIGMLRCTSDTLSCAFEELVRRRIFTPAGHQPNNAQKQFLKYRCVATGPDIKAAVIKSGRTDLKRWLEEKHNVLR